MSARTLLAATVASTLMSACATAPVAAPASPEPALLAIARSAGEIQASWNELGAIERSRNPAYQRYANDFGDTLPLALSAKAVIDWNGPIEPLIRQIAKDAQFAFRVTGRPPTIPVSVAIVTDQPTPLAFLLRDAGFQAGDRAGVVLGRDYIEIKYPE